MPKSYFIEHFFCRTNLRGLHYVAWSVNEDIQVVLRGTTRYYKWYYELLRGTTSGRYYQVLRGTTSGTTSYYEVLRVVGTTRYCEVLQVVLWVTIWGTTRGLRYYEKYYELLRGITRGLSYYEWLLGVSQCVNYAS